MRLRYLLSLGSILAALSCTHEQTAAPTEVVHHPGAEDDKAYYAAFKAATRETKVYGNFETKYFMHVTYFSPQFRAAFHERYKTLYKQNQPVFDEASKNAGFFVSLFTPEGRKTELDDQTLWTIMMAQGKSQFAPIHVKHLSRKEQWYPFFPYVSQWTKEYFVLFEAPSITPHSPDMVKQTAVELTFSNADAHSTMTW